MHAGVGLWPLRLVGFSGATLFARIRGDMRKDFGGGFSGMRHDRETLVITHPIDVEGRRYLITNGHTSEQQQCSPRAHVYIRVGRARPGQKPCEQ